MFLAASAQAALVYIDRARLRHMLEEGTPRANALSRLLDEPIEQPVDHPVHLHAGARPRVGGRASGSTWTSGTAPRRGSPLCWASSSWCVLLLAQFLGRVLAVARPESVALAFVRPVEILNRMLFPLLVPLNALEHGLRRVFGVQRAA